MFISCTLFNTFLVYEFIIGGIENVFFVDIPVIPEVVLVNNPETINHPPAIRNSSGHQNLPSSTGSATDSGKMQMIHLKNMFFNPIHRHLNIFIANCL